MFKVSRNIEVPESCDVPTASSGFPFGSLPAALREPLWATSIRRTAHMAFKVEAMLLGT